MKTLKEKTAKIRERYNNPQSQISPGIYLESVGYKYVTLLNIWGTTKIEKISIDQFYDDRF